MTAATRDGGLAAQRAALETWLAGAAGAARAEIAGMQALTGGAIQENWLLEVDFSDGPEAGRRELVLRTDSPSGVQVSQSASHAAVQLTVDDTRFVIAICSCVASAVNSIESGCTVRGFVGAAGQHALESL